MVPTKVGIRANTLTAIYYPEGVKGPEINKKMAERDVLIAGGLLPEIKTSYFRVGHMGSVSPKDMIATLSALEYGLKAVGHSFETGAGIGTFQEILS